MSVHSNAKLLQLTCAVIFLYMYIGIWTYGCMTFSLQVYDSYTSACEVKLSMCPGMVISSLIERQ